MGCEPTPAQAQYNQPLSTIHGPEGEQLKLRAVIFDYGMVLSGPPDPSLQEQLFQRSGLPRCQAEELYWKYRHDYDRGDLTGLAYWQLLLDEGGGAPTPKLVQELAKLDARMWTGSNQPLVDWLAALRRASIRTALLSNLGDVVTRAVLERLPWMQNFDVRVFSYQLRTIKPDPSIYRHTLSELGTVPEETLFVDDIPRNIDAARALGIQAIQYTGVQELRTELEKLDLPGDFPLPDRWPSQKP